MTSRDESQYNDRLLFLADDDNDDIDLFKDAVAQIGIRSDLYVHSNGQQLLDTLSIIAPLTPDLIFLDINMPVKNGFETLVEIRTFYSDKIPVFFLSTSRDEEEIENARRWGATGYLSKSASLPGLKKILSDVLLRDWAKGRDQDFYVRIQYDYSE
ncbi:response regulator [Dyadobacter sp. LHD-138]|uniref:response regulator n=1 Tax=Dyadobacter sp. LHD-138 TaxID=3071413 RepID=UPI0027DFB300|nr:response regulator [Dyadobacter sp. LHD-138]MDQ6480555.1 response regulator [Dyadobacter sp. LHD-138]